MWFLLSCESFHRCARHPRYYPSETPPKPKSPLLNFEIGCVRRFHAAYTKTHEAPWLSQAVTTEIASSAVAVVPWLSPTKKSFKRGCLQRKLSGFPLPCAARRSERQSLKTKPDRATLDAQEHGPRSSAGTQKCVQVCRRASSVPRSRKREKKTTAPAEDLAQCTTKLHTWHFIKST